MSLNIGKLENDSLEKAVDLIEYFVCAGIEFAHNEVRNKRNFENWGKPPIEWNGGPGPEGDVWNAWELLMNFGDLGDAEGMFSEFASIYNSDRGYDD